MKKSGHKRIRGKGAGKGRAVDPAAQAEVSAAIDGITLQRDHLIECLHRIQDRYKHLSAPHLTALADLLQLAPTEVYEVATFYHHFDVVREGESAPPDLTVRVCDSVSCSLFGAEPLISALEVQYGEGVRIQRVPCIGRCDTAPVAVVGQTRSVMPMPPKSPPLLIRPRGRQKFRSTGYGTRLTVPMAVIPSQASVWMIWPWRIRLLRRLNHPVFGGWAAPGSRRDASGGFSRNSPLPD